MRFDLIKKDVGLIDYSLDKIFRGRGWGKLILDKAIKTINHTNKINSFKAKVKKTNQQSIKIFRNLLFIQKKKKKYLEFNKNIALN